MGRTGKSEIGLSRLWLPVEVFPDSREYALHQIFKIRVSQALAISGVFQRAEEMHELGNIDALFMFTLKKHGKDFVSVIFSIHAFLFGYPDILT